MAKAKTTANAVNYDNLVIVESPAKAKTIEKFLGNGYKVTASNGHLIDLPKSKIGVDIENNFEPSYIVIRGRTPLLNELKKLAAAAKTVYLATDPDREGEAISWHIAKSLGIPEDTCCRVEFNEITKNAVIKGISNPRTIDINKVDAQQARRVLDRLVGYKLSPLLWSKIKPGLSAGRVQSVAVRLIVDRENDIRNFIPKEYWTITATLEDKEHIRFTCKFYGKGKEKLEPSSKAQTDEILSALDKHPFIIKSVNYGKKQRKPFAPFTTSTLQQDASRKLGFTTKRTMMIAQGLYEGIKISSSETVGLITYMRTDSTRISAEALGMVRGFIEERYGKDFLPQKPNFFTSKKNAQDAHEAIRPTYIKYTPESIKDILTTDQYKLYNLIYSRFLASQMTPATYDTMAADIECGEYNFHGNFTKLTFQGWKTVYNDNIEEEDSISAIPPLKEGDICNVVSIDPKQNFTTPPARYTEASLVKALEELGVGRPSTYAPIISTIMDRSYVIKEKKNLIPTDLGEIVTKLMEDNFADIVNVKFTADMEEQLDAIAEKGTDWHKIIADFYDPFEKNLERAQKEVERVKLPVKPAGVTCELCGAEMVIKTGRFGDFIACPNYPECKNTKPIIKPIKTPCPKCGSQLIERKSKKGKTFYGCSTYPECDFSSWNMPLEDKCPTCGAYMEMAKFGRRSYKKCSNENCPSLKTKKTNKKDKE